MKNLSVLALCVALWSCGAPEKSFNQLTEQQKAEGWQLLFDGTTTNGWKIFKDRKNISWEVLDGTLHCKPPMETPGVDNERSDLMTVAQFDNFELSLEWKLAPQSNSGIIYRVTEEYEQPYHTGPEYQVIDDKGYPQEKEFHMTGANYDMHVATNKKMNPLGEWNTSKIIANGNHIEHWLNDVKVVEYEIGSEDWTNRKNESKWKDVVGYCVPTKGHIDLQDHGGEVWYRNIMIRKL
jgi:Domain of Unknown Function (DUF1080).